MGVGILVDLHLHTTASDGRWTPEDLIEQLLQAGIGLFAVTDHESLDNLSVTGALVRDSGLRFLPGIELSARLNGQVFHLLAYGFDPGDPGLNALAQANSVRLNDSSDEALRILARAGYPVPLAEYEFYSWDRRRGGWKGLNFLIDHGICRDVHSYFGELFGRDLALPQGEFVHPEKVISVVRRAGGVVILAHPGVRFYSGMDARRLDELVEMGVQGLECYSCHHDENSSRGFVDYCRSRDLLITGGSDCHGGFTGRALGSPQIRVSDLNLGDLVQSVIV